jgi:hypothetical protein
MKIEIPYLFKKIKGNLFGEEEEISIEDFKKMSPKIRLGGKDWYAFGKDLEELKMIELKNGKVRLKK